MLRFFGAFVFAWNPGWYFWQYMIIGVIILSMSGLLLPSPDSSRNDFLRVTKTLGVPLDVYDGYFIDGDTELNVIIDTTDHPQVEGDELYSDPLHEVSVSETNIDGTERKIASPDADRYPLTRRIEGDKLRLALIGKLAATYPDIVADMVILQGPNWRGIDK